MKFQNFNFILLLFITFFISCSTSQESVWLVPNDEVLGGGVGKDGIPSVDNPKFETVANTTYLQDEDLVVGFKNGNTVRVYSHRVLDWHEIINDEVEAISIAITYCPLTGTAIGWDREIEGSISTFGVSGKLYNSNLIPYDRKTDSNWSQMRLDCINGKLIGEAVKTHQIIETTYGTIKEMFPNAEVITTETGFNRDYTVYPYINAQGEDYRVDGWMLFNVDVFDFRLPRKERVLGVINNGEARAYQFELFDENEISVIQDTLGGEDIVIIGSEIKNFIVAFSRTLADGTKLDFSSTMTTEGIVRDHEDNVWNIFGEAISGPRTGQKLQNVESFIGYWVAWSAFYHDLGIYGD